MTNRAVALVGFVVCAGITAVWGLITPDRLYTFLLAAAVVLFIHLKLERPNGGDSGLDPEALRRIQAMFYAQGLQHGAERARVGGGDGTHRTHARTGHNSKTHLPKVG